ncbi:MAG TPA: non-homologous end-joining DNA ligase [Solirubrobacterales bacterium]|jgi:bifunctional non-homologous end joining protein LigD|nr:non-homologous end-joining DNA ligase [Solirubrobacterales bacterium]
MAAGKLGEYERKRDFEATPEPSPGRRRAKNKQPRFVVQEHSARRLHWDLRLERDGVAPSWAVPNGIPRDPDENRKAVHTEDHPLEYLDFEGEIPAGEYGAGTMRVWDRGTYECHKWDEGKIVVSFRGERLRGRYALFRAGREEKDWVIHRVDPPTEEWDPFPDSVLPMMPRRSELPDDEDRWGVEVAWDGLRAIAYCQPGRIRLVDSELEEVIDRYPEVRRLSRQLGARDAVLDGELVAFGEDGRPSSERLAKRLGEASPSTVRRRAKSHPVTYVIFDLLHLDGDDLLGQPYRRRRELLDGLGLDGESWQTPSYSVGQAEPLLEASREQGLGGLVLKHLDSPYSPGKRSGEWLRIENDGRSSGKPGPAAGSLVASARPRPRKRAALTVEGRELEVSNLDKVLYPSSGFSKGQLIDWYAAMAATLLPHLRGRPLTLKRYPDGVEGKHFYEKRCPKHRPEWVRTASIWSDRHGGEIDYCLVEDLPTLVWTANLADIELHTSLSRAEAMERPTTMVFDLDPGPPADVIDCARVALWIRGMLEQLGLSSYVKTSGSKGLQLYVPLNNETAYGQTRPFAKAVAETLERKFPKQAVSRMTKSRRAGKVLIDWSQNDPHKTTVCVYSLRARDQPTVSMPLEWDEVESAAAKGDAARLVFDHAAALRRIEAKGDLFAPLLSERQDLPELG